jgi:hypothetical protein
MGNFNAFINTLRGFIRTFVYANFWVAGAVWGLTRFSEELFKFSGTSIAVLNAAATLVVYGFARLFEGPAATDGMSRISQWRERMPKTAFLSMGLGVATILFELIRLNEASLTGHYALAGAFALLYPLPFILKKKGGGLRSVPGLKLILIALVWAYVTAVIPALRAGADWQWPFIERFLWTAALTIPFDVRDAELDANSIRTLPHLVGSKNSVWTANLLLWLSFLILVYYFELPWVPLTGLYLFFGTVLIKSYPKMGDLYYSLLVEGLPFLLLGLWYLLPYL